MDSPRLRDLRDRLDARARLSRRFPPNGWSIAETERRLVGARVEWVYVFDLHGRQLLRQSGTRRTVSLRASDLPLLRGAIVVHNHPADAGERGESLTASAIDLVFAVRFDVAELRIVAPGWTCALHRPTTDWPVDDEIIQGVYDEHYHQVADEFALAVADGLMPEEAARRLVYHETLRRVAEWGRFSYTWTNPTSSRS